jgi:hypothetical protein
VIGDLHPSTIEFLEILEEMRSLSMKKQADYGSDEDPFHNVRASEQFGMPAWVGAGIRISDKVRRLQKAAISGQDSLECDSIEDDLIDIAVYGAIGLLMFRQAQRG